MARLLFEKTGNAIWMSHLDLMRLFQRAFKRANLPLTHTHGYNPRPSVSIALPLSVGVASHCELLDFELDGIEFSNQHIMDSLNQVLVDGIKILQVYTDGRKLKDLSLLKTELVLEYDSGISVGTERALTEIFASSSLIVPKKTKNGIQDQDIMPMIREVKLNVIDNNVIKIELLACCQNPTLNPMQLVTAIKLYAPEYEPNFASCCRQELYDAQNRIFR